MPAARLSLVLPLPPSVNHSHGVREIAGKSKLTIRQAKAIGLVSEGEATFALFRQPHYRAWIKEAGLCILAQRPAMPVKALGPGFYGLRVRWPQDMRGDNSNRIKALEDFLAYMRITPDDRFERKLDAGFSRHVEPGTCAVTVWTLRP